MEQEFKVKDLKTYCAFTGMSGVQLAEKLGITKSTVYSYFNGERMPNRKIMNLMVDRLDFTPEMLYEFFIKEK